MFVGFEDQLPLDTSEQLNSDCDVIGNIAGLDYDIEGISDNFEIQYNLDRVNADCVLLGTYFDQITNFAGAMAIIHLLIKTMHLLYPPASGKY
jgi:hypothetical protein